MVGEEKKDCNLISDELKLGWIVKELYFKNFESKSYERTKKMGGEKKSPK